MARGMTQLASWWGRSAKVTQLKREFRAIPAFERMEARALMAAGVSVASTFRVIPISPTVSVVTVSAPNRELLKALQTFLIDLQATYGEGGTGATADATATLKNDLLAIANLAGTSATSTQAVERLNSDVSAISDAGTITDPQKVTLLADLEDIAVAGGLSSSTFIATAGQILGVSKSANPAVSIPTDFTDPNALNSTPAGQTRGQEVSTPLSGGSPVSASSALPIGGLLGSRSQRLFEDLKAELAQSQAVTSAQKAALRRDFSEIAKLSHRPSNELITELRTTLDSASANGLTNDLKVQIAKELQTVLQSAGLTNQLIAQTLADFQPILDANDITASSVNTILSDLANLLSARPKSGLPLGSWFLGA